MYAKAFFYKRAIKKTSKMKLSISELLKPNVRNV